MTVTLKSIEDRVFHLENNVEELGLAWARRENAEIRETIETFRQTIPSAEWSTNKVKRVSEKAWMLENRAKAALQGSKIIYQTIPTFSDSQDKNAFASRVVKAYMIGVGYNALFGNFTWKPDVGAFIGAMMV